MQRLEGVRQTAGVEVRKAKEEVERLSHEVASESQLALENFFTFTGI